MKPRAPKPRAPASRAPVSRAKMPATKPRPAARRRNPEYDEDAYRRALAGDKNLRDANLHGANLAGANLQYANLHGANLAGANLRYANLVRANLEGANLEGANLEVANLEVANLEGANLKRANLIEANLADASLDGANLRGAYLYSARLGGAYLAGVNLEGANLEDAYLRGADLEGANLEGANLRGANLYGAHLVRANLMSANLEDAYLRGANLEETILDVPLATRPSRSYGRQTGAVLKMGKPDAPTKAAEFKKKYPADFERLKGDTQGRDFSEPLRAQVRQKYETPFVWLVTDGKYGSAAQRLCPDPNLVLKFNIDPRDPSFTERQRLFLTKLAETARRSEHPHETRLFTVGWVRICVNEPAETWLVEEVQSDVGVVREKLKDGSAPPGLEEYADVVGELRPYIDRFYEDALGVVFIEAEKRGYAVEMLTYETKKPMGSPRSVYNDLPRSMGMQKQPKSKVLRPEVLFSKPVWYYKPNPRSSPRSSRRGREPAVTHIIHYVWPAEEGYDENRESRHCSLAEANEHFDYLLAEGAYDIHLYNAGRDPYDTSDRVDVVGPSIRRTLGNVEVDEHYNEIKRRGNPRLRSTRKPKGRR